MNNINLDNQTLPVNENVSVSQIQETDIQPSGLSHAFDTGYAIIYGVDEAIMIRNLQFFITSNANRGHNLRDGRFWTYDRIEDFIGHFPYWSTQTIRRIIASLISQGVIIKGEFNEKWSNRTQWYAFKDQSKFIKNIKIPKTPSPLEPVDLPKQANGVKEKIADLLISTTDRCWNQQLTDVDSNNCYNDTSTIPSEISSSSSLKVPEEPAAIAADGLLEKPSVSKKKKAPPDFSSKVRDIGNQMINLLVKHNPVYRPPGDLAKFLHSVQEMIEVDNQNVDTLLQTFEYAVSDNEKRDTFSGWQSIVATNKKGGKETNPAKIFREYFSKIHSQMNAKVKRKFSPSSNDAATAEKYKEWSKNAL